MKIYWFNQGMAILPISFIITIYLTLVISYIVALATGDIYPVFPFISDTGAHRPESSVFGQLLNISAVIAFACLYVRYRQVQGCLDKLDTAKYKSVKYCNIFCLLLAFIICFGFSVVANFQEICVGTIHLIGAYAAFGCGTLYECIQTYITYKMHPEVNGLRVFSVRLMCSILSIAACFGEIVAKKYAKDFEYKYNIDGFHWKPGQPGYSAHLASTFLEWCIGGIFMAFFYTFIRDFQKITLEIVSKNLGSSLYHVRSSQLSDSPSQNEL